MWPKQIYIMYVVVSGFMLTLRVLASRNKPITCSSSVVHPTKPHTVHSMEYSATGHEFLLQSELSTSAVTISADAIRSHETNISEVVQRDYTNVLHALFAYVPPILFMIGLPGNALSIALVSRRSFNASNMKPFIVALALADSFLLILGLGRYYLHGIVNFEVNAPF